MLYGSAFWAGLLDWMKSTMVSHGFMNEEELDLITMCDTPEEVVQYIRKHVIV